MSKSFFANEKLLYALVVLASISLSVFIASRQVVLNPDAICYLSSAQIVGTSGIHSAMQLCGQAHWPFYSVLIYAFAKLTHFSYPLAAYVLDGFFSALSVVFFILIVKQLGGTQRVLWLAAIVILCAHEFNSARQYIIRDHGYWTFYLASVLFLLRYFEDKKWQQVLAYSFSLSLATLFRIEGAIFVLALPFTSLFLSGISAKQKCKMFLSLYAITILVGLILGAWLLTHPLVSSSAFGRAIEIPQQFHDAFFILLDRYQTVKNNLSQYVLTIDSVREAGLILILLLLSWYVINVISNVSWVYAGLLIFALYQKIPSLKNRQKCVLAGYIIINLVITLAFLGERLFLSERYLMGLTLILILWVPFALDFLITHNAIIRIRMALSAAIFLMIISSLGGIFDFGYSKLYLRDAGDWMATHITKNNAVYCNDYQLMYYSRHFGSWIFRLAELGFPQIDTIADGRWKQYDYLALRINKHENSHVLDVIHQIKIQPIITFQNKRGDRVAIYANQKKSMEKSS